MGSGGEERHTQAGPQPMKAHLSRCHWDLKLLSNLLKTQILLTTQVQQEPLGLRQRGQAGSVIEIGCGSLELEVAHPGQGLAELLCRTCRGTEPQRLSPGDLRKPREVALLVAERRAVSPGADEGLLGCVFGLSI